MYRNCKIVFPTKSGIGQKKKNTLVKAEIIAYKQSKEINTLVNIKFLLGKLF